MNKQDFIRLVENTKMLMSKCDELDYFTQRELYDDLNEQIEANVDIIDNLAHSDNKMYFDLLKKMKFNYWIKLAKDGKACYYKSIK